MSDYTDLLNTGKAYLGKLCQYGHEFQNSGMSIRYKAKWQCIQCKKQKDAQYRELNKESVLKRKKDYYEANKEKHNQTVKEYRERNKDKIVQYYKEYCQRDYAIEARKLARQKWKERNKDKIKMSAKAYRVKARDKRIIDTQNYRARKREKSIVGLSVNDTCHIFASFRNCCAYCGNKLEGKRVKQLDHFIPLNNGGTHCKSNLVPACISCNSSKRDLDPIEWYKSRPSFSESRLKKILKSLGKTEDNYRQITFI